MRLNVPLSAGKKCDPGSHLQYPACQCADAAGDGYPVPARTTWWPHSSPYR